MKRLVAILTKGSPVAYIKSKFGIVSKRFDMMSVKVPAFVITTFLAGKFVSGINIKTPSLVLSNIPQSISLFALTVFVAVALFAAWGSFPDNLAYLDSGFNRMGFSKPQLHPLLFVGHSLLGFIGVMPTLKGRGPAFGWLANLNPRTVLAFGGQTVPPAVIGIKSCSRFPSLALVTPLQPIGNFTFIFFNGNANTLGGNLDCAFSGLSHC